MWNEVYCNLALKKPSSSVLLHHRISVNNTKYKKINMWESKQSQQFCKKNRSIFYWYFKPKSDKALTCFGFSTINWVSARVSESCQNGIITRRCHRLTSQGSVATHLKGGGIFNDEFISDSPLNLALKELRETVSIRQSYQQEYSGTFSNVQLPTVRFLRATMRIVWPGGVMVMTLDSRLKGSWFDSWPFRFR